MRNLRETLARWKRGVWEGVLYPWSSLCSPVVGWENLCSLHGVKVPHLCLTVETRTSCQGAVPTAGGFLSENP